MLEYFCDLRTDLGKMSFSWGFARGKMQISQFTKNLSNRRVKNGRIAK